MAQMASDGSNKRRHQDIMKLMMSDYEVHIPDDTVAHDFVVKFRGPTETPYEGGVWKVHVVLPREYPYKSPSIGFLNSIFHPNIDEMSGSVCLDVINQTWSPMYNLVNIFDMFLPHLLRYPNAADPLNGDAAALMIRDPQRYASRIRDHVMRYASADVSLESSPPQSIPSCSSAPSSSGAASAAASPELSASPSTVDKHAALEDDASDVSEMSDCDF